MSKKSKKKRLEEKDSSSVSWPLVLVNHPAARRPWVAVCVVLLLIFMVYSTISNRQEWGILVPALLLALLVHSLIPFFWATTITFTPEEISVQRFGKPEIFKWDDYRSYSVQDNGVVLWMEMRPAGEKAGFGAYFKSLRRSVFLPLAREDRGRAEEILGRKLVRLS